MTTVADEITPELLELLREHLPTEGPLKTLGRGQPNWITEISAAGVLVETERTRQAGQAAQLVPAWMIRIAWERLVARGHLTNTELLATNDMNVKRSSFVCAALACLPGVEVLSARPITLAYSSTREAKDRTQS